MKKHFLKIIPFCLISSIAYPMSSVAYPVPINLDETSKAKLIAQAKKELLKRNYWPDNVAIIELEEFYKESDTKYFVRVGGHYPGPIQVEYYPRMRAYRDIFYRPTKGYFSKEELESLGVVLPE